MNIDEVLKYEPSLEVAEQDGDQPSAKRARHDDQQARPSTSALVDSLETVAGETDFDETSLKRLLFQFERKVLKNQEMRIKHGDNPQKFMESELELFDVIKEMHIIATQPSLYEPFIKLNMINTMLSLLAHENTDVACAVVELLQELTDFENAEEIEGVGRLMEVLIENQITLLLVNNMERLNENVKEEADGIHNSLEVIENLTDYEPELTRDVKPLMVWILKKLRTKPVYYPNKLYASEILSILLQNNEENKTLFGTCSGIDILLKVISYYKKRDPETLDEEEYMENLFNCLCSALFLSYNNRRLFYVGEGIELMNLILNEKRKKESNTNVRVCALKLLNHSLSTEQESIDELLNTCCDKFIQILGLRVLMPIFLKPTAIIAHRDKKKVSLIEQVEEHSLSLILALLRFCKPENVQRVLNKFTESNMVKTERLVELHLKYSNKLRECDKGLEDEGYDLDDESVGKNVFVTRLNDGGLFTLQIVDHIIVLLASLAPEIKQHIVKLLRMHARSSQMDHISYIKNVVNEYAKEKVDKNEEKKLFDLSDNF